MSLHGRLSRLALMWTRVRIAFTGEVLAKSESRVTSMSGHQHDSRGTRGER